tara:strand:- start:490 stop:2343 length:1854 start_codon:yes stop_codon:yes gene_type:complete
MIDFDTWIQEFDSTYHQFNPTKIRCEPGQKFYRVMELDCTRAQDEQRTVEATLSTETPVMRGNYHEVLSHEPDSVNLERASDGTLPLLWGHDQEQLIGSAENVRVHGSRLRAQLRFSKSRRGEEVWQDVKAGHVRGISIGYVIQETDDDISLESRPDLVATRWMPFEASCVSVPADTEAGIGRALDAGSLREMPASVERLDLQYVLRNRYSGFQAMREKSGREFDAELLAEAQSRIMAVKSAADAESANQALADLLQNFQKTQRENRTPAFTPSFPGEDFTMSDNFSLCRAISMTFDPNSARASGPEYGIMQDAAATRGKKLGDRYTLPEEILFRSVTKGGSGANLVGVDHLGSRFVPALRERMITGRMGATILPGLTADIQIPRASAESTASWIAGDGSDAVTASDPTFDKISMSPTTVGCSTTMSRKMLLQGDPATEQLLRDTLAHAVAKAIDVAAVNGSGASNQPTGILSQTNLASSTYTNGTTPSFGDIVDLEGDLMVDDADMGNLGYVTTASLASTLKQTEIVATTGTMIWTANGEAEGRMNGYRSMTSNLMPAGYVLFGNWSDLLIGLWSGLDFVVDPYTRAAYGDIIITVYQDVDIAVRHGESFAEIHEA